MKLKSKIIISAIILTIMSQTFIFLAQNEDAVVVYLEIEENDFIELRNDGNYYILQGEGHNEFDTILTFVNRSDERVELENVNYYIFDQDPSKTKEDLFYCQWGQLGEQILDITGEKGSENPERIHFKCQLNLGKNEIWIQVGEEYWDDRVTKIDNLQKEVLQRGAGRYPITIYYYTPEGSHAKSEGPFNIEDIRANKNIIFPFLIVIIIGLAYKFRKFIKKNYAVITICVAIIGILISLWWKL